LSKRISQGELESYLWGAATLLRGTIDAGEYKAFIFPLLFLKRLSDVYDEEFEIALTESDGDKKYAALPEQHRFQVPSGAHWSDIRSTTTDVGKAIAKAAREIEKANPRLGGVFGDAPWTNKDRLPDSVLRDLVEHYSGITLSIASVPEDELGVAYEFLIKKFADDSGHTAAEFYTNRTLVHLMTQMLEIKPGDSVYDPTCGSGGMLLSAADEVRRQGKEHRTLKLYGQELNLTTSAIARMNLFLHGIEDFDVVRGDTLANPAFNNNDKLRTFDVVLANPPYSIKSWDRTAWQSDKWGRNQFGTPPQGCADFAFWQHILSSMDRKNGRCAILFPHGVLFREAEAEMRQKMIDADVIETVLGLGPNLFYNSPMEACIVICRSSKPKNRQGKVLFINAVDEVTRQQSQSFLTEAHISRIVDAYRSFSDIDGFASVATTEQLLAKQANLNIVNYVAKSSNKSHLVDLPTSLSNWASSSAQVRVVASELFQLLESRSSNK
jgi:type I restriction enzyme M protein